MPGANHDGTEPSGSARIQAPQVEAAGARSVAFESGGTLEPHGGSTDETGQGSRTESTGRIAEQIQPDLERELESFRRGDISRAEATRRILRAFEATGLSETARDDGETHYLDQLEEIRRQRDGRLEHGSIGREPGNGLERQTESSGTLDTQTLDSSGASRPNLQSLATGASNPFLDAQRNDNTGGIRPVIPGLDAQAEQLLASVERDHITNRDDGIEEFYEDDTGRKRRRVLESEMPWFTNGAASMSDGNPAAAPTRKIISDLGKNLSESKRFLHIAPNLPAGFPSSEWDNILAGRYVNFDVVYGAVRFDAGTREYKQGSSSSEGLPELRQTSKVVNDVNSWYAAWSMYQEAVLFVFNHRREELAKYGAHISSLFRQNPVDIHTRIIKYDRAIRLAVAGGQQKLLSDQEVWHNNWSLISINSGNSDNSQRRRGRTTNGPRSDDVCRRYNNQLGCNFGKACLYTHKCRKCGGAHSATACTDGGN